MRRYNLQRTGPKIRLRDVWPMFITLCAPNGRFYTPKTKNPLI